jgi:hypothetical protein
MMIPVSSNDLKMFYRNDSGMSKITGSLRLPYRTGNHQFDFMMEREANGEQQVKSTTYVEHGAECVLDVNFNHSK